MAKRPLTNWLCASCNKMQWSRVPKDWICKKCRKAQSTSALAAGAKDTSGKES